MLSIRGINRDLPLSLTLCFQKRIIRSDYASAVCITQNYVIHRNLLRVVGIIKKHFSHCLLEYLTQLQNPLTFTFVWNLWNEGLIFRISPFNCQSGHWKNGLQLTVSTYSFKIKSTNENTMVTRGSKKAVNVLAKAGSKCKQSFSLVK